MNDKQQKAKVNFAALARMRADKALERLDKLMDDPDPRVQLGAIKELLDRGFGKAAQPISGDEENPLNIVSRIVMVPLTKADGSSGSASS